MRRLAMGLAMLIQAAAAWSQVSVQEYRLPPGHFARDVWADADVDRTVWIAFQGSGHLGVLNPKTGKVDLVALGEGSLPHGVIAGPDGAPQGDRYRTADCMPRCAARAANECRGPRP